MPPIERHLQWIEPALQGRRVLAVKTLRGMTEPLLTLGEAVQFIDKFMSIFPPESTSNKDP